MSRTGRRLLTDNNEKGKREMKNNQKNEAFEWIKAGSIAVLAAVSIRAFLFSPIIVDGESMMPTLQNEDRMIVNKIQDLERFDIIVFHASEEEDYIKRIIGLPGDYIEYKNDVLYINGKEYEEPYLDEQKEALFDEQLTPDFTLDDTPVNGEVVPEGHFFVMGDNRRYSKDSRHIGAVPIEQVEGEAKVIFWPLKDIGAAQ